MENEKPKVEVTRNGPYMVSGMIPLEIGIIAPDDTNVPYTWAKGDSLQIEEPYFLCRCGNSKHKPFCDDTHLRIPFDGSETASTLPFNEQAFTIEGPSLILKDAKSLCSSSRFCTNAGGIRKLISQSDNTELKEVAIQQALDCPSGRLVILDKNNQLPIEETSEKVIRVVEDPGKKVSGPLYLKGGIEVISTDGKQYEMRNRITLCRCGKSGNKPFCDGSHIKAGFNDGDKSIS